MAAKKVSPTLLVLREIRDAVKATNDRVDDLRVELTVEIRATNARLDALYRARRESLARRMTMLGELRKH